MVGAETVGRDAEIEALQGLVSRAGRGHGALVAVEGPAGIGKSRLLAHARQLAVQAGWRVLDTRCTPLSQTIESCVLRDWFATLAHRARTDADPFAGPGRALRDLADGRVPPVGDLAYAVRWALEELSRESPVLLVVDDLHWADPSSVDALDLLASAVEQLPCLVVYAVRSGEPTAAPDSLHRLLAASQVISPHPWSLAEVAEFARSHRPRASAEEIHELTEATGGVPFLVVEKLGAPGVPESVVASIRARLGRLPDRASETARAVCLLGPYATLDSVSALTERPMTEVADDVSVLVTSHLLIDRQGRLSAVQPLVCEAVLATLSALESSRLHRRAADILALRGVPRAAVLDHLLQTLPSGDPEVRERLRERGELALGSGDMDRAARYFERALVEGPLGPDHIDLMSSAARALAGQRRLDEALSVWERATELAPDEELREQLRAEAGDALMVAGRHRDARETLIGVDGRGDRPVVPRMVLAGLLNGVSLEHLRDQVSDVLAHPPTGDTEADRQHLAAAAVVLAFDGRESARARDLALRAIGNGAILRDAGAEGSMIFFTAGVLRWTSAFSEGEAVLSSAILDATERRSVAALATASVCRGAIRMQMGQISEAVADLQVAQDQRGHGWNAFSAPLLAALVECRVARGELDRLDDYRDELEELIHVPGLTAAYANFARADIAAANADHERAADLYAEVGRLVEGRMDNPAILPWRAGEALNRIRIGQSREAVALARANADHARAFGSPYAVAQSLRTLAAVDATGDRVAMLREALRVVQQVPAPRLEAQIGTDLAGMLLLTQGMDDTREPVQLLRRAESYAAFQELRPLIGRVQRILERIGEPVKRPSTESLSSLTASERRVAELAASGLSNRQIASELFVTVKAVEWHLSNVYRKLGIRSRTRLPGLLSGQPGAGSGQAGSGQAGSGQAGSGDIPRQRSAPERPASAPTRR